MIYGTDSESRPKITFRPESLFLIHIEVALAYVKANLLTEQVPCNRPDRPAGAHGTYTYERIAG